MINVYQTILLIMLSSCSFAREPLYIQLSDQMIASFTQEVKNEGLQLLGSGGGFMNDINKYNLYFVAIKNLDVNSVRKLYLRTMDNLLNKINNNQQIRPYLHIYPFTRDQIKLIITFDNPDGKFVDSRYIAMVTSGNGKIVYFNNVNGKLNDVHSETYDEALKIVRGQ